MKTNTSPEYVGDCTVLDKAEFARLIRKHRGLRVTLFVHDSRDVADCSSVCTGFTIPVKAALEKLARCDFDAFAWEANETGPKIWHYAAPIRQQLQRRRDFLIARIPATEARIARIDERLAAAALNSEQDWRRKIRASEVEQIASDRAEIARLDNQIAAARTEVAA